MTSKSKLMLLRKSGRVSSRLPEMSSKPSSRLVLLTGNQTLLQPEIRSLSYWLKKKAILLKLTVLLLHNGKLKWLLLEMASKL